MDIFDPNTAPITGMATYPHPSALTGGESALLENLRLETRVPALRSGSAASTSTNPSGTFVSGGLFPSGSGGTVAVAAMDDGASAVRIYGNSWNGSAWSGWNEVTEASGKYGNTRFSTSGSTVTFTAVPKVGLGVDIIAQNGVDAAKVMPSNNLLAGDVCANIQSITAPKQASQYAPTYGPKDTVTVKTGHTDSAVASVTNTGPTWNNAATNYWDITVSTTPTANEDIAVYNTAGSTLDLTSAKQVWVLAEASNVYWLNSVQIDLYVHTGPVTKTIHDPSKDKHVEIPTAAPGLTLYVFPIEDTNTTTWEGLKFTLKNVGGLASGDTFKIYGVGVGGRVPCLAEYAMCWHNTASRTDSPGVVLKTVTSADKSTLVRGSNVINADGTVTATSVLVRAGSVTYGAWTGVRSDCPVDFTLPLDTRLYCSVTVPTFSPNSTDGGRGVDYVKLYRRDPGETDFTFVNEQQCAQYTAGNWTYYTPYTAWDERQDLTDNTASEDKILYDRLPDAFTQPVPVGLAMCSANKRLYVGVAQQSSATTPYSSVQASEEDAPYRFRSVTRFTNGVPDLSSGFEARMPTGETVKAMLASSSSLVGHSGVYAWTDRAMYLIDYLDVSRVGSAGCVGPYAACEHGGQLFWLDPERVLRMAGATVGQISRNTVHDLFTAIPAAAVAKTSLVYYRDRLYVNYSASGSANTNVLVWNAGLRAWESRDTYDASASVPKQILAWRDGATDKVMYFSSAGKLYQYESGGAQDDGSYDIPLTYHTQEYSSGDNVYIGPAKVYCTAQSSKTLTVTRYNAKKGTTSVGTGSTAASGSDVRTFVGETASGTMSAVGASDASVQLKITGTFSYPFSILRVTAAAQPNRGRGGKA